MVMKISRITIAIFMLLTLILSIASGCSTNGEGDQGGSAASNSSSEKAVDDSSTKDADEALEEVNLVFYHSDSTGTVQKQIDAYEALHPNVTVDLILTPSAEYNDKLKVALAGGEDIDVYITSNGANYSDVAVKFQAEPLGDRITADDWNILPFGNTITNSTIDGQILGIPTIKGGFMLYYNKDIFDEAGIPYPSDDMTWDEYADLAKQLTKGEGQTKVWGSFMQNWAQLWYMPLIQAGQTIFDDDLTLAKEGLELRASMQNEDLSEMQWAEVVTGKIHHRDAFAAGNVAMMVIGDWMITILNGYQEDGTIDFDYDVTNPPHPEGVEAGTTIGGPGVFLSINGNSEHKDEAWEFIKFMAGKEGSMILAESKQSPAYVDDEIIDAYLGDEPQPEHIDTFLRLNTLPIYPFRQGAKDVDGIMGEEGTLYFIGEQSIEETMENIVSRRIEALDQYE
jgi:multiple sugar transport system substrate-binding protein